MNLEKEQLQTIGVLTPLKSNFEIDSTSHYGESIALHSNTLRILQQDTKCSGSWPTIHCMQTPQELVPII